MEAADAAADEQLFFFFHFVLTIFPFFHFGVYVQCPPPPNYSGFVDFWRTVSKIFRVSPCDLEQKNVLENVRCRALPLRTEMTRFCSFVIFVVCASLAPGSIPAIKTSVVTPSGRFGTFSVGTEDRGQCLAEIKFTPTPFSLFLRMLKTMQQDLFPPHDRSC